ncbi:gamma-glutamyltransferase [Halocatena marina]|uniref:gamma-glutamyltransferase n=1 Tax=Halocatena marina TaxID=2934937 RepID=UPI00200E32B1|nr:gamma-glutamyltransferase [Halocatena marina]
MTEINIGWFSSRRSIVYTSIGIVATSQSKEGVLSKQNLRDFEPEFLDSISTTYNGATIYERSPNNQDSIFPKALNVAEEIKIGSCPYDSSDRGHYFLEAMKVASLMAIATSLTRSTRTVHRLDPEPGQPSGLNWSIKKSTVT